ncbi:hypothetical protein ACFX14_012449 [Malus domestica]
MTEKGKGTTLLLTVGTMPIYVDLHPPQPGKPANKKNAQLFFTSERALSAESLEILSFFSPDNTSANKPHQSKSISYHQVKSKSISYHVFSLSFPLALFLPARQGQREQSFSTWNQASSQELITWNPLPDYLPGIALEYSYSTSYASREDTTYARRTDRASEKDIRKHVETSVTEHVPIHPLLCQQQKYPISSGLNVL